MANRHLSRSIVLQSLFEWDFGGKPEDLKLIIDRNIAEFAPGHTDNAFIYTLAELVQRKQTVIDDILTKAAPEWPLEKISNVDRSVLRMGLAELLFGDREQVPPKVAINEAIELANSTDFGLISYVYSEDLKRAIQISEAIESGMVAINRGLISDPAAPFGGVKQSGLGREGGFDGIHEFLETKYIGVEI